MPLAAGLDYEEHGGGILGPPLVFLHGAGGSRLHWPPALRRLAGWRTLAVDLPGHGRSPAVGECSIDDFARRLRDWRVAAGIERPLLVGHSMGGAIALASALAEPAEAVAGLVLIGCGARLRVNPSLLADISRPEAFSAAADRILAWSFAPEAPARLRKLARLRLVEAGPDVLAADLRACHAFDVRGRLNEITLPTLIVVGDKDRMTPPQLSEELRAGIAGATVEIIEAAGHMAMLEQPDAVAGVLRSFLEDPVRRR